MSHNTDPRYYTVMMTALRITIAIFIAMPTAVLAQSLKYEFRTLAKDASNPFRKTDGAKNATIIKPVTFGKTLVAKKGKQFVYLLDETASIRDVTPIAAGFDGQQYWFAAPAFELSEFDRQTRSFNTNPTPVVWVSKKSCSPKAFLDFKRNISQDRVGSAKDICHLHFIMTEVGLAKLTDAPIPLTKLTPTHSPSESKIANNVVTTRPLPGSWHLLASTNNRWDYKILRNSDSSNICRIRVKLDHSVYGAWFYPTPCDYDLVKVDDMATTNETFKWQSYFPDAAKRDLK